MQQELIIDPADSAENGTTYFHDELLAATPRAFVTPAIIALNILVFLVMVAKGVPFIQPNAREVLAWGANFGPLVDAGQWWRLFAACFLHFGIVHIGVNMFVLWQVGIFTERLFGNLRFAVLYLIAGVGGNIAGLFFHPFAVGAGASGAIFGVYGALLAFLLVQRGVVPREAASGIAKSALLFVGYNLIAGLARPETDQVAHIGGILSGFLAGCVLARPLAAPRAHLRPALAATVTLAFAALGFAAVRHVPKRSPDQTEWYTQIITAPDVTVGHHDRVVYTGAATADDARHVAKDMQTAGIFQPADVAVLLRRDATGAILSIPLRANAAPAPAKGSDGKSAPQSVLHVMPWDDPKIIAGFRTLGPTLANSAGGPPLTIRLINDTGEPRTQIRINSGEIVIATRDRVLYSVPFKPAQAQAVGALLQGAGIFRDTGVIAILARAPAGTSLLLLPTRAGWPDLVNQQFANTLAKNLVPLAGSPVKLAIADTSGKAQLVAEAQ